MKIRTDFVTNSSSSSFVCEACGRIEAGYDMSYSDVDMCECINGHVVCTDEIVSSEKSIEYEKEQFIKHIDMLTSRYEEYKKDRTDDYYSNRIIEYNQIKERLLNENNEDNLIGIFEDISYDVFEKDYSELIFENQCPLCSFTIITDRMKIEFALEHFNMTGDELENKARDYFKGKNTKLSPVMTLE